MPKLGDILLFLFSYIVGGIVCFCFMALFMPLEDVKPILEYCLKISGVIVSISLIIYSVWLR